MKIKIKRKSHLKKPNSIKRVFMKKKRTIWLISQWLRTWLPTKLNPSQRQASTLRQGKAQSFQHKKRQKEDRKDKRREEKPICFVNSEVISSLETKRKRSISLKASIKDSNEDTNRNFDSRNRISRGWTRLRNKSIFISKWWRIGSTIRLTTNWRKFRWLENLWMDKGKRLKDLRRFHRKVLQRSRRPRRKES